LLFRKFKGLNYNSYRYGCITGFRHNSIGFGISLRYWINRRKFYRRSPTGAEGFSSYEKSVIIKTSERLGKWIAYALIIFGVLFLWSYSRQKKAQEKASQNMEIQKP